MEETEHDGGEPAGGTSAEDKGVEAAPEDGTHEWHERRRLGVGGSDLSKIFGYGPWEDANPQALWEYKMGLREPKPPSVAAQRGTNLEPHIINYTSNFLNQEITEGYKFYRHPDWEEGVKFQANTDGTLVFRTKNRKELKAVFEAKTTKMSTFPAYRGGIRMAFKKGYVPLSYALQVQMYLDALKLDCGVITCAVGPKEDFLWKPSDIEEYHVLFFRYCPEMVSLIKEGIVDFWETVEAKKKPDWFEHRNASRLRQAHKSMRVRPAKVKTWA